MRKLYAFALAVGCALAVSAANTTLPVGNKQLSLAKDVELQQMKSNGSVHMQLPAEIAEAKTETPNKAPQKAAAISAIEGEWNVTYSGMLTSNSGKHEETATFTWVEEDQEFEVDIPGYTEVFNVPLFASYNETTGKLTFKLLLLGQTSQGYVAQWPMIGTSVVSTTTGITATYNESTGSITFDNVNAALGLALLGTTSTSSLIGYYWAANNIVFERSEFDYSLKVAFEQEATPDNKFTFTVTKGTDVAEVYAVLMEGDNDAADLAGYGDAFIQYYGDPIEPGTYTLTPESGMEETGYFTVMVFAYNADGTLVKKTQDCVFVTLNEDDQYQTIGTVAYNDLLVNGYYNNFTNNKNAVEIQENISTPGLYRLVDAYAGQSAILDKAITNYIYIDAQDPEFVNIKTSSTGLDFGDGLLTIGTFGGALGYSKQQCLSYGYEVGSLDERTITFGARSVLAHEKKYNSPGSWSYMNSENVMTIELPELVLNVTVLSDDVNREPLKGVTIVVETANDTPDAVSEDEGEGEDDEPAVLTNVTNEEGQAVVSLPASVDYLATVKVTATDVEGNVVSQDVKLNGAENNYEFYTEELVSGVADVTVSAAAVEYFNLQGVRIDNPVKGQVVIERQGTKAVKVIVK